MCDRLDLDLPRDLDLVVFDLDGTLYPNDPRFDAVYPDVALRLAAGSRGVGMADERPRFRALMDELGARIGGRPTNTLTLLAHYDVSFDAFEAAIDRAVDVEGTLRPDPRAVAAVAAVARSFPIALYTTNNDRTCGRILDHLGLASRFPPARRFTLSDVGRLPLPRAAQLDHVKPGLAGFRLVLERFGAAAGRTLMVGDSDVSDLQPARLLGMTAWKVERPDDLYDLPLRLGIA